MNLEIGSQWASIISAFIGLVALFGLGIVYKKITKQSNKNNIVVNGQAYFEGSFNVSNEVDEKVK